MKVKGDYLGGERAPAQWRSIDRIMEINIGKVQYIHV